MANRLRGSVYIVDSTGDLSDMNMSLYSVAFYATDTTGELQVAYKSNTTDVVIHVRSNQNQPFTLPLFLDGHYFSDQLTINRCTAGTAFFYLR